MEESMKAKGKDAKSHLTNIAEEVGKITDFLGNARQILEEIVKHHSNEFIGGEILNEKKRKTRSMILGIPHRLEFISCKLRFYIDFTLISSQDNNSGAVKGSIVYGTNRTKCFRCDNTEPYGLGTDCEGCQLIERCDKLEDRPLVEFLVNKQGMIESGRSVDGEGWISELYPEERDKTKQLAEVASMHFQALRHIWKEALKWTNENLLP